MCEQCSQLLSIYGYGEMCVESVWDFAEYRRKEDGTWERRVAEIDLWQPCDFPPDGASE